MVSVETIATIFVKVFKLVSYSHFATMRKGVELTTFALLESHFQLSDIKA
jgi:hypothetical protein